MSQQRAQSPRGGRNLTNFLDGRILNGAILTSPRSLDVCATHGVRPEELLPRPMESFVYGNVPRAIVERRYKHFEQKRSSTLEFLIGKRQELVDNPPEEKSLSRSSSRVGTPRSISRCNSRRNMDLQRQNYESVVRERDERNKAQHEATTVKMAKAEIGRSSRHDSIRQRGEEHWNDVANHREGARLLDEQRHSEAFERATTNDMRREANSTEAQTARAWKMADKSIAKKKQLNETQLKAAELEEARLQRAEENWSGVQTRSDVALLAKEEYKYSWAAKGQEHASQIAATQSRAAEIEESERHNKTTKLMTKEERLQEMLASKEEAELRAAEDRQQNLQRYYETVGKGHERYQERAIRVKEANDQKESRYIDNREQMDFTKMVDREDRREQRDDHVELVTRLRRARDYQREKYLRNKVYGQ